ncbi:MAG: hypothetical protein IPN76_35055 [Saprospiraceae bacterium]|nr:hypothetical protein [Saprospiraceae bacterium]
MRPTPFGASVDFVISATIQRSAEFIEQERIAIGIGLSMVEVEIGSLVQMAIGGKESKVRLLLQNLAGFCR